MRSEHVVFPASMWAMIPKFRVSFKEYSRGIECKCGLILRDIPYLCKPGQTRYFGEWHHLSFGDILTVPSRTAAVSPQSKMAPFIQTSGSVGKSAVMHRIQRLPGGAYTLRPNWRVADDYEYSAFTLCIEYRGSKNAKGMIFCSSTALFPRRKTITICE